MERTGAVILTVTPNGEWPGARGALAGRSAPLEARDRLRHQGLARGACAAETRGDDEMTFLAELLDDDGPVDLEVDAATAAELHRLLGEAIGHNCARTVLAQVREERARRGVDDGE